MSNKSTKYKPLDPEIVSLTQKHGNAPEALLEIFQILQDQRGGLSRTTIEATARSLKIPAQHAYGLATFYSMLNTEPRQEQVVRVCNGPVCWLKRATQVRQALDAEIETRQRLQSIPDENTAWRIENTSCLGLCDRAPAALVGEKQAGPVDPEQASKILQGWYGQLTEYSKARPGEVRVMMAHVGDIDPDSLQSALEHDAYLGLQNALAHDSEKTLKEVEASGLTGRGGAGFPVGRKWRFVAQAEKTPKYVICNADESEPLIFKDRVLIDSNPHQILEGMAIAGYATGAQEGYIYIRGEYASQARRLEKAIREAERAGWLGKDIQGSSFSFHIHVHRGAGAYICGEETALIESLEGKRGEPRSRPPYPPSFGYKGLPTLVNNVESYAAVPSIMRNGASWYRGLSTASTPGTKMYMILGHVNHPGLFEAPFGLTLRQTIDGFGGGMLPGSEFNFALTGGAAGTIVPSHLMDIPIDYASASQGVSLGAGAFLICDQSVSPLEFLRELLRFFSHESCGKCTPCRVGTSRSFELLSAMAAGDGKPGDAEELMRLADGMQVASFCGLGQSVAIPMKSALTRFSRFFSLE